MDHYKNIELSFHIKEIIYMGVASVLGAYGTRQMRCICRGEGGGRGNPRAVEHATCPSMVEFPKSYNIKWNNHIHSFA